MSKRPPDGLRRARRGGQKRLLVLGTDDRARSLAGLLVRQGEGRVRVVGHVRTDEQATALDAAVAIFALEELATVLREQRVDELVATRVESVLALEACDAAGVPVTVLAELAENDASTARAPEAGEHAAGGEGSGRRLGLAFKRGLDVAVASLGLAASAPLIGLAALAVQASSPGPIVSRQTRCGLHGRRFGLVRLRTERGGSRPWPGTPRVRGRVGRFVHDTGIDDLLLLWNVLRGEMSLVGPRPPLPVELARSGNGTSRRLSMRPGLTCLWQIRELPAPGPDECAKLDLQYVDGWSLGTDLKILLHTVPAALRGADG